MTRFAKSFLVLSLLQTPVWAHAYSVANGNIYDGNGRAVQLRGLNWFGFETADHVAHGLWARNWKDMIAQMKSLGFNAVRLPVCPATLAGVGVNNFNASLNPDLSGKNSLQILDAVIAEFDRQGFYILLDHHRLDCNDGIAELWYGPTYTEQQWIGDLSFMAGRYKSLPHFLGVDLKNEPHGAATWGTGNAATDWNKAAEKAAAEVLAVAPDTLVFVEGVQDNPVCSGTINHWWGGNLEPLACHPLAIPTNRLVLSPHVYGPDVYSQPYFNAGDFPNNMPAIWNAHFGQFKDSGYTLAIGETGGKYGHGGDAKDKVFQNALVDYLLAKQIKHLFYWAWNPNSGDTGGILQDDWTHAWQDKVDLLNRLWGGATPAPSPAPTAAPSPTPVPKAACADGLDNDGDERIDYPNDPGCSSSADNDESNPVTSPAEQSLPAKLTVNSDWGTGYCADVTVTNSNSIAVLWKTAFTVQGTIHNLWNAAYTQTGEQVDASGLSWNSTLQTGASANFGFCAERTVPKAACADGRDNDGDGLIDYPSDPGCSSVGDNDEFNTASGGVTATLTLQSDWKSGYCAQVDVKNAGSAPVVWNVTLTIDGKINNIWNAVYTQSGATLKASGLDWNKQVPAGGKVQFGFCAVR
ncbi:MAG: cellulase family glycosylhydrolase [Methylococcus sp.]|nr:cellulase family glycosylhydrolase [Methylococcus sp.]